MSNLKSKLAQLSTFKTPFYYYDMEILENTLKIASEQADRYGYHVHYAIKANSDEKLLKLIASYGFGADCVSGGEVERAVACGFPAELIAFAGVGKSDDEIFTGIDNEIFSFNCESLEELVVINELAAARGKVARVALRLNPEVDPQTHAYITTGKAENKFGIAFAEVEKFIDQIPTLKNIHLCGLHFHIGSQITKLEVFNDLCKRVNVFVEWFESKGVKIESLNMGGGLGINYQDPANDPYSRYEEYFAIFAKELNVRDDQSVHFELGRSIVGQCGYLISRALFNKVTTAGREFVILDSSMTELLRPALYGAYHHIENLSSDKAEKVYDVAGGVCESTDVFAKERSLPETKRGDIMAFYSAGAYGAAMASEYNLRPLPKSVYSDEL